MPSTPLLDGLKKEKKQKTILVGRINEWLKENGRRLDVFTEEDWEFLRKLIMIGTKRDRRVFSPSAATNCSREQVINKHKKLVSLDYIDPHLQMIFDDGRWRHVRLQMMLWKMGLVKSAEEFKSYGDLEYGGSIDVIVEVEVDGKKILVITDFKGSHASQWNEINSKREALLKHRIQVAIYCYLHPDVAFGLLLYENKNTNDLTEIIVKPSPKIIERAVKRQKYMKRYVQHTAFPREECDYGNTSDRRFTNCPQRLNCGKLPVHQIRNGKVIRIADPRKKSKEAIFVSLNQLHPASSNELHPEQRRRLKGSAA